MSSPEQDKDVKRAREEAESESIVIISPFPTPKSSPVPVASPDKGPRGLSLDFLRKPIPPNGARIISNTSMGGDSDCFDANESDISEASSAAASAESKALSERLSSAYAALSLSPLSLHKQNQEEPAEKPLSPIIIQKIPPTPKEPEKKSGEPILSQVPEPIAQQPQPAPAPVQAPPQPAPAPAPVNDYWDPNKKYLSMRDEANAIHRTPRDQLTVAHKKRLATLYYG